MTIEQHKKTNPYQKDFYTISGFIGETKVSKDGKEIYEPVRLFPHSNNTKFAISISVEDHDTVAGETVVTPIDCVCWSDADWKKINKMNLATGDRVKITGYPSTKDGKTSHIFAGAGAVQPVKNI